MNISENPKVAILLAAFNGCEWLTEQINSILRQTGVRVTVFISVDISSDSTYSLCKSLSEIHDNIHVLSCEEKFGGAGRNFYRLFRDVNFQEFNFISLSDQDDIWFPEKLINAIDKLSVEKYDAYSSNVTAFWPDGRTKLINKAQPQTDYDYFFEPSGPGCTYVLTRELALKFKSFVVNNHEQINEIICHDWLIYAFARYNNHSWFIDASPSMLYRQHANNQVGANVSYKAYIKRVMLVKSKWYRNEVLKIIHALSAENHPFINACFPDSHVRHFKLALNASKCRRRLRDRNALMVLCLFHFF